MELYHCLYFILLQSSEVMGENGEEKPEIASLNKGTHVKTGFSLKMSMHFLLVIHIILVTHLTWIQLSNKNDLSNHRKVINFLLDTQNKGDYEALLSKLISTESGSKDGGFHTQHVDILGPQGDLAIRTPIRLQRKKRDTNEQNITVMDQPVAASTRRNRNRRKKAGAFRQTNCRA